MKLATHGLQSSLEIGTRKILQGTLSPLCGINQEIGFFSRSSDDPKLVTVGVELSGVHELLHRPDPGKGGYHIGGMGVFRNEALIKALGESCERYSQLVSCFSTEGNYPTRFCSYSELIKKNETPIPKEFLDFFSQEQLHRPGFIFDSFDTEKPLHWLQTASIPDQKKYWIPSQLLFVGYNVKKKHGEPWIYSAVTTGTAVHINYPLAIRNALLELIQIDAAMGHWYGSSQAFEIEFDERNVLLQRLLKKYSPPNGTQPKFYWLPNADLLGLVVACVLHHPNKLPKVVVGLGSETDLAGAMYKAYLEAAGIVDLARVCLFRDKYHFSPKNSVDEQNMFDLDSNISFYAKGLGYKRIEQKFFSANKVKASDLPPDIVGDPTSQVKQLILPFAETHKKLFFVDLTSCELRELKLISARIWSPDLISLCLPSAVPCNHSRFKKYGGVSHAEPHPYP